MSAAACAFCGVPSGRSIARPAGAPGARMDIESPVCDDCGTLDPVRPGAALRAAARVLGVAEEDPYLHEALREEGGALDGLLFADPGDPLRSGRRTPQPEPWLHVPRATRAALRRAQERSLELRLRADCASAAPAEAGPPHGPSGCLACGVGRSPEWSRVLTGALTRGPNLVEGFVCDQCGAALREEGAVGATFLERAVMRAKGLDWSDAVRLHGLQAWVATGRPPGEPWEWVELHEPTSDLNPVQALQLQVADLRAEVASLRAGVGR